MKKLLPVIAIASIALPSSYAAASIISVPETGSMCCIGEINPQEQFIDYFGQTFVALGSHASNLTFPVLDNVSDLFPGPFSFKTLILDTGNQDAISNSKIMFESDIFSVTEPKETAISVDLSGLEFIAGHHYAWAIDTVSARDGIQDVGQVGIYGPSPDLYPASYADGQMFYFVSTELGREADLARAWNLVGGGAFDMSFQMTFLDDNSECRDNSHVPDFANGNKCHSAQVPEPSALALLAAGLLGLVANRRRIG